MDNNKKPFKGYHWLSKAWYGETNLRLSNYADEILIEVNSKNNNDFGEFAIRWHDLKCGRKPAAKIECFDDAFHALWECQDLLRELSNKTSKDIQPAELKTLLDMLGYKDLTEYKEK